MKKSVLGCLCLTALLTACAPQVADNEYLIAGTVTDVPDSTVVHLQKLNDQFFTAVACDTVMQGRFELRDTVSSSQRLCLTINGKGYPNYLLNLWVAPGQYIELKGNGKLFPLWDVKSDIAEQQEENRFAYYTREPQKQILEYNIQESDILTELSDKKHQGNKEYQEAAWNKIDSIQRLSLPFMLERTRMEVECMKTAPVSQIWLEKLETNATLTRFAAADTAFQDYAAFIAPLKELYMTLPDSIKQTTTAQKAYHALFPKMKAGDVMTDGTLYDPDGNEHHLAEFKGQYILLDFWSQTCGPCRRAIPELEEVARTYAGRLTVVCISTDPQEVWKQCLQIKGMKGIQWNELRNDGGGLQADYGVQGLPHYVLIAPDGKVKYVWTGYWKGVIRTILETHIN
ncbi:AhpC/TSA family protein [Bacteroidales bacterium SW292]|nr:AhpC/TSA family protein [Bacteroidales bacterium SW292]